MQSNLNNFLGFVEPEEGASSSSESEKEEAKNIKIKSMWSRVKNRDMMKAARMVVHDMDEDLKKLKKTDNFKYKSEN